MNDLKNQLLRRLPSVSTLLADPTVAAWLAEHPRPLVTDCLREALDDIRGQILADTAGRCGPVHVTREFLLGEARRRLDERTRPHIRPAVNATGVLLHTALGRAVWPETVTDSLAADLKGYVTLAVDRRTGERSERHHRVEYILRELTGAEAATVVNNNAGATLLAIAALAGEGEVIVSRGQLIEIGGAFRLPDVMAAGGAAMVEVGTTNRTHLRDYERAFTERTAAVFRAHPSNYRILGFTKQPALAELVELAHARGVPLIDDLGAGALVDLEDFGLPHEPTIAESVAAGADVVLASTDKLIGAAQGGLIVGRRDALDRIRAHPLARALRADKTCLMALERTLHLFRDPQRLRREHPLYRMLATPPETLRARAAALAAAIADAAGDAVDVEVAESVGFLGSGSLPMEQLPTFVVRLAAGALRPHVLAERLRMDEACVFGRVESDRVVLDVRTMTDDQVAPVAAAVGRVVQ